MESRTSDDAIRVHQVEPPPQSFITEGEMALSHSPDAHYLLMSSQIFYQAPDEKAEGVELRSTAKVLPVDQVYQRRFKVQGTDWTQLDKGWHDQSDGFLVIENRSNLNKSKIATPEEETQEAHHILEVSLSGDPNLTETPPNLVVRCGSHAAFEVSFLDSVWFRSSSGKKLNLSVAIFPTQR